MQANAAGMYEVNKPLVVEDVEVLEPQAHEVLVRFVANGVCHSDLHVITGDYPHPLPVVLGHEAAGIVQKVGAGVESVKAVSELFIPVGGEVIEINEELGAAPEKINEDPYGTGWMIRIRLLNHDETADLMSAEEYDEYTTEKKE